MTVLLVGDIAGFVPGSSGRFRPPMGILVVLLMYAEVRIVYSTCVANNISFSEATGEWQMLWKRVRVICRPVIWMHNNTVSQKLFAYNILL